MELSGHTVLITGGTSGLGLAFAEAFLKEGSKVIICGRREHRLQEIGQKHPGIVTRVADVATAEGRENLARWVIQEHPQTDILINNAGVQLAMDLTRPLDLQRIYHEVDTNLVAPVHLASLLTPHLSGKANAAIINISSGLAFAPLAFMPIYCATKAAIHSYTMSLRHQLRHTAIKVFEIAPPSVDTELGHDRREDKTQSHGGMPIADFITEAMQALRDDVLEAPIAMAKNLHQQREALFPMMNRQD